MRRRPIVRDMVDLTQYKDLFLKQPFLNIYCSPEFAVCMSVRQIMTNDTELQTTQQMI